MDLKPRPNHARYLEVLRAMRPQDRLKKAIELSDMTKKLFKHGLRKTNPTMSDEQLHRLFLDRLAKCHNQNY